MRMAEIERDLRDADPRVRYHIARLQEEIVSIKHQMRQCADLLVAVVNTLNELRVVNLKLNERWERRLRGEPDLDMVQSVLPDPDEA